MKKGLIAGIASISFFAILAVPWAESALDPNHGTKTVDHGNSILRPIHTNVSVIAHRGASAYGPEHTLAAYKQAIRMKADFVEFDLQMTKDGHLIAMHDETLARTTNAEQVYPDRAPWRVKDFTLEEIKRLDAGSWFNKEYPRLGKKEYIGQHVPTLDEAIQVVKQYGKGKVGLYMETKAPNVYPGMEGKLIGILGKSRVQDDQNLILESFSEKSLRKLKVMDPNLKLIQLYTASMLQGKDIRQEFKRISDYAYGVGPSKELVAPELINAAHRQKLLVHAWTANSKEDFTVLLSRGVDGEFTNKPDQLAALLNK